MRSNYMWELQREFQSTAQSQAIKLFSLLDERLNPEVYLIGVPDSEEPIYSQSVCIEPMGRRYTSETLSALFNEPRQLDEFHPYQRAIRSESNPRDQKILWEKIKRLSLQNAIESTIQKQSSDVVSFCSVPQEEAGFLVSVVLLLNREIYYSYHKLTAAGVKLSDQPIYKSLLDATTQLFLSECARALHTFLKVDRAVVNRNYEDLIASAGYMFMQTPVILCGIRHSSDPLFFLCNEVSEIKYEKHECKGVLILARPGHPNIQEMISFTCEEKLLSILFSYMLCTIIKNIFEPDKTFQSLALFK